MYAFTSSRDASTAPQHDAPKDDIMEVRQEEFEHEHLKRAMFRAVGGASPVIAVLLVILVFSFLI